MKNTFVFEDTTDKLEYFYLRNEPLLYYKQKVNLEKNGLALSTNSKVASLVF